MDFTLQEIFTHVLLAECFVGVTVNVFIVAVQIMKWKAVRSLDSCDQILLCLSISRIVYLTDIFSIHLARTYRFSVSRKIVFDTTSVAATFLLYFISFWFIAVLCVYYCVKIANYNHKVFISVKTRISRLVPWFIGASVLISVVFSIPCTWSVIQPYWQKRASTFYGNGTVSDEQIDRVTYILVVLSYCIPLLICCGSIYLLIHSLWRHTRQMKYSKTGFQTPNIEAHVAVVKNMSVFLFIQALDVCCSISTVFTLGHIGGSWKVLFSIIASAPSVLHSAHMIYSNAKLNQAFRGMWHGLIRRV